MLEAKGIHRITAELYDSQIWQPDAQPWFIFFTLDRFNKLKDGINARMFTDMQLLQEKNHNITIGFIDVLEEDGELLKETLDVDHARLPCIRLVKDGRFHEMVFY